MLRRLVGGLKRRGEQATPKARDTIARPELRPVEAGLAELDPGIPRTSPLRDPGVRVRQDLRHLSGAGGNDALAFRSRGKDGAPRYSALASALHGFVLQAQASTYSVR
jgi:hypothetical protein